MLTMYCAVSLIGFQSEVLYGDLHEQYDAMHHLVSLEIEKLSPIGNINEMCYCSEKLLKQKKESQIGKEICKCCFAQIKSNIFYSCGADWTCLFLLLTGYPYLVCNECYTAKIQEQMIENDVYSENDEYDDQEVVMYHKAMVSLEQIS